MLQYVRKHSFKKYGRATITLCKEGGKQSKADFSFLCYTYSLGAYLHVTQCTNRMFSIACHMPSYLIDHMVKDFGIDVAFHRFHSSIAFIDRIHGSHSWIAFMDRIHRSHSWIVLIHRHHRSH